MPGLGTVAHTDLREGITTVGVKGDGQADDGKDSRRQPQRSQRGSETSSGHSSCSSSEVSSCPRSLRQLSDSGMSGMDLSSIAEQVFEELSVSDTDTLETSCCSDVTSVSGQPHHMATTSTNQDVKLSLNFNISSPEEESLYELYRQILDWLDPDSNLFVGTPCRQHAQDKSGYYVPSVTMETPSLAVVLYLHEEAEAESLQQAQQFLSTRPWKFHHREGVTGMKVEETDYCQDYYMLTADRPLCSVRQVQCGKQHLRIIRYVTHKHWKDTLSFYSLILGQEPTLLKRDLCLFTLSQVSQYDVQFGLKKLHKGMVPKKTRKCELCFRVCDIGSLVPLFPNVCHKVSDVRWCTKDLDGNRIHLQVPKLPKRCRSVSPSKLYAHYKKSAFSPVVPNKRKLHEDKGSQVEKCILDKLSPRVYISRQVTSRLTPGSPSPTTPHSQNSITNIRARPASTSTPISTHSLTRNTYNSPASNSLRTRPSSANELERRHTSECVRTRPSSASTVLDDHGPNNHIIHSGSTTFSGNRNTHSSRHSHDHKPLLHLEHQSRVNEFTRADHKDGPSDVSLGSEVRDLHPSHTPTSSNGIQSPYCFHSHTDSGFVDSTDTSFARDPRRTPIIGNQLSKLASYSRIGEFTTTQTNTTCITNEQFYSSGSYGDLAKTSQIPDYCSSPAAGISGSPVNCTVKLCKNSVKSRVESYIEDQNEMLGLGNSEKSNSTVFLQNGDHQMHAPPVKPCSQEQLSVSLTNSSHNGANLTQSQDTMTTTRLHQEDSTQDKTDTLSRGPDDSQPLPLPSNTTQASSPAVVDAAQHDLDEYMRLCWGSARDRGVSANNNYTTNPPLQQTQGSVSSVLQIQQSTSPRNSVDHKSEANQVSNTQQTPVPDVNIDNPILSVAPTEIIEERLEYHESPTSQMSKTNSKTQVPQGHSSDRSSHEVRQGHSSDRSSQEVRQGHIPDRSSHEVRQGHSSDRSSQEVRQGHIPDRSSHEVRQGHSSDRSSQEVTQSATVHTPQKQSDDQVCSLVEQSITSETHRENQLSTAKTLLTKTDSDNTLRNNFTLGQFLNNNKVISAFLRKTSPDLAEESQCSQDSAVHLPDLVQINDCDLSKSVINKTVGLQGEHEFKELAVDVPQTLVSGDDVKSEDNDVREGCPDDIVLSGHPLKSCLPHRRAGTLKRVKFSEINSHHFYVPLESEDSEAYSDEENMDSVHDKDVQIPIPREEDQSVCLSISGETSRLSGSCQSEIGIVNHHVRQVPEAVHGYKTSQTPTAVSTLVAKFNSWKNKSEADHVAPPHDHYRGDTDLYQSQDRDVIRDTSELSRLPTTTTSNTGPYSDKDWKTIKQQPQVGFYI